jgi:hypothetical protein
MFENMDIAKDMIGNKDFFAKEILIWLWYMSEKEEGHIKLDDNTDITLFIEDKLVLVEIVGEQEDLFKGGIPSESIEAKYALKSGKVIKECRIKIIKGNETLNERQLEWLFNFKAEGFSISGVKLPVVEVKDYKERFKQRMFFLEELYDYLFLLYRKFILIRLKKESWKKELEDIRKWIGE